MAFAVGGGHPTTPLESPSHFIEAKTHRARTTWENLEKPGGPTIFQLQPLGFYAWLLGWLVGFVKLSCWGWTPFWRKSIWVSCKNRNTFWVGNRAQNLCGWWKGLDGWTSVSCLSLSHVFLPLHFNSGPCNREAECSLTKTWQKTSLRRILRYMYDSSTSACSDFWGSNHHYLRSDLVAPIKSLPFSETVDLGSQIPPQKKRHPNAQQNIV